MARIKGSGEQYVQTLGVRTKPEIVEALKNLALVKNTSYSQEVREALENHLQAYRDILLEAARQIRKDVTVAANVGVLMNNIKAMIDTKDSLHVEIK